MASASSRSSPRLSSQFLPPRSRIPTDEIEQSRAAEATTATRIAELERELAQLTAAREEAAIRAGQANEAYLEASVHLEEARIETRRPGARPRRRQTTSRRPASHSVRSHSSSTREAPPPSPP